jgi:hypothetical protein
MWRKVSTLLGVHQPINDALNTAACARHSEADRLWNRPPVCHSAQFMPVELEDSHVVGSAEACRTPDDDLQHLFKFAWRGAYNPQNLGGRGLLFYGLSKVLTCIGERHLRKAVG